MVTMSEHCFPMLLWKLGNTEFSRGVLFVQVYPWVVTSFNFFLPFFLIGLFTTLIICHMKLWKMTKKVRGCVLRGFSYSVTVSRLKNEQAFRRPELR